MTYADLAQILQNRIIAGLRAGRVASDSLKQPQRPDLEVYVAALEKAVAGISTAKTVNHGRQNTR